MATTSVLVVDDEPSFTEALSVGLEREGFTVRTVLRRARNTADDASADSAPLTVGDVTLDVDRHEVTVSGETVALALREFELLGYLMSRAGRVVTREVLMRHVWGHNYIGDTKTVDTHIMRLRVKLEPDPAKPVRITTIRGVGYRYERSNPS